MVSNFRYSKLSSLIESSVKAANSEILIAAPYIKIDSLSRLQFPEIIRDQITIVSRWNLSDIVSGSTDVEIYPWLRNKGISLKIHPTLHAKYYRIDDSVWTGSANLTRNGLSDQQGANFEILTYLSRGEETDGFEKKLLNESVTVTDDVYLEYSNIKVIKPIDQDHSGIDFFWPRVGSFEEIWSTYVIGNKSEILETLGCPPGLNQKNLRSFVRIRLREFENIRVIENFLISAADGRRFGEVRALIREIDEEIDETAAWQNLMQLLLDLFPDRFEYLRPNHTEILKVRV
jgi:phosphatidylserine/phosphatidylglycerophosphate/cardiolipin synthase-like enzyme